MDPPTAGLLQTRTSAKAQRGTLSLGVASHVWIIIGIQKMVKLETNRIEPLAKYMGKEFCCLWSTGLEFSIRCCSYDTASYSKRTGDVSRPIIIVFKGE